MPYICYGSPTEFGSSFLHKPCPPWPSICDFHLWLPKTERELKSTSERVWIPNPWDQWCIHYKIHKKLHQKICARHKLMHCFLQGESLTMKKCQWIQTLCSVIQLTYIPVWAPYFLRLLSHIQLSVTQWTAARQASPSITNSWGLLKLMFIELVMPSSHLILSSSSPPAFNLFQHQGFFQWVSSSHLVAKVLEFQLQHQSFQGIFRTDLL